MPETPEYGLDYPGDKDAPNGAAQIKALAEDVEAALAVLLPAGTVLPTARKTAPTGFLLCEGQAVSRTTYKRLFEAISTTYGAGNGSTTFNLPDLRGRVPVGVDGAAARLTENDEQGKSGGEEKHKLTTAELAKHTHPVSTGTSIRSINEPGTIKTDANGNGSTSGSAGGDEAHNNMQPFQVVQYMVKI